MNKIQEMQERMDKLKAEMKEEAKAVFKPEAMKLFKKYPELEEFKWQQYTPYFNDGDTCEFSAHTDWPTIILKNGKEEYDELMEDDGWADEGVYGKSENSEEIETAVTNFLEQFNEDLLFDMFGDHAEITVTRKGVEVEEYSHD